MINLKNKANISSDFFGKQCQPIPNNSTLPSIQTFETPNRLCTIDIDLKKVLKIMQDLNSDKAHGNDGISTTRMLKLYGHSTTKSFSLLGSS